MNPYPKQNDDVLVMKTNNGVISVEIYLNGKITKYDTIRDEKSDTGHRFLYLRKKYTEPEIPEEVIEFHKQTKGKK